MGKMAEEVLYYELDDEKKEYVEQIKENDKSTKSEKKAMLLSALGEVAAILAFLGLEYLVLVVGKDRNEPAGAFLSLAVLPFGLLAATVETGARIIEGFQKIRFAKRDNIALSKAIARIEERQKELTLTKS